MGAIGVKGHDKPTDPDSHLRRATATKTSNVGTQTVGMMIVDLPSRRLLAHFYNGHAVPHHHVAIVTDL